MIKTYIFKALFTLFIFYPYSLQSSNTFYIIPPCGYENEKLFNLNDPKLNRDNCMYPFYLLKEKLQILGYDLKTTTYSSLPTKALGFIVCNLSKEPYTNAKLHRITRNTHLLILEPPTVVFHYYNSCLHQGFKSIFTLCDYGIDNKKYFKLHYPVDKLDQYENIQNFKNKRLLTLIAGYKISQFKYEIYSERVKSIKYFEEHCSEDEFHLFGNGWDKLHFKSYKGSVRSKNLLLKNYKFAFCYENTKNLKGYITEKIIDCFKAGCVPIYWGAPDIADYIPANCFIDRRQFNTHKDLHNFLNSITEEKYNQYQKNIKNYLKSSRAFIFSSTYFTHTMIKALLNNYDQQQIWSKKEISLIQEN